MSSEKLIKENVYGDESLSVISLGDEDEYIPIADEVTREGAREFTREFTRDGGVTPSTNDATLSDCCCQVLLFGVFGN